MPALLSSFATIDFCNLALGSVHEQIEVKRVPVTSAPFKLGTHKLGTLQTRHMQKCILDTCRKRVMAYLFF